MLNSKMWILLTHTKLKTICEGILFSIRMLEANPLLSLLQFYSILMFIVAESY